MGLLKTLRKTGKLLRGGASPRQVFLGAFIGVLLGLTPGINGVSIVLLAALLLLNANTTAAVLCYAAAKPLALLLAPVTFALGRFLIHDGGLSGFVRWASGTPVLAWMDLQVYCVLGGLAIGLPAGVLSGFALSRGISFIRRKILVPTTQNAWSARLVKFPPIRFILWLAFGPAGETPPDTQAYPSAKSGFFRPGGLWVTGAFLSAAAAAGFLLSGAPFAAVIKTALEKTVGAETDVRNANVSFLSASATVEDLQVTDPSTPHLNLLQADTLKFDLSMLGLLSKRLIVDELQVRNLLLGTKRASPGTIFSPPPKPAPEPSPASGPSIPLQTLLKNGRRIAAYFQKASEILNKLQQHPPYSETQTRSPPYSATSSSARPDYFSRSASGLLAEAPTFLIRRLVVDNILLSPSGPPWEITVVNLSSHPRLVPEPMVLRLFPGPGRPAPALEIKLDFRRHPPTHHIKAAISSIPLGGAFSLGAQSPVILEKGTADFSAEGTFTASSLDVPFTISVRNLRLSLKKGKTVLGLDPATSRKAIETLQSITVRGRLHGSLLSPKISLDVKHLVRNIGDSLAASGKAELSRRVQEARSQIRDRLEHKTTEVRERVNEEIEKARRKASQGLQKSLQRLFKK